jgi:hypothetical protein
MVGEDGCSPSEEACNAVALTVEHKWQPLLIAISAPRSERTAVVGGLVARFGPE